MQHTITTMYVLGDNLLHAIGYRDDPQSRLSGAEVMTVPLVAAAFFGGNMALARHFLHTHGYFTHTLSASRFSRRLHQLPAHVWATLFALLGEVFKAHNATAEYVVDSLPIAVCDNIRIQRCRLFPHPQYEAMRGYIASKRRYFYGFKVHLLVTGHGQPVEFVLTHGSCADINGLRLLPLELPATAVVHGDKAYYDRAEQDLLAEAGQVTLQALTRSNAKAPLPLCKEFVAKPIRQRIETTFSQVTNLLPKHIHAVTPQGFVLKLTCFLLAFSFHCLCR